jgi:competence protein ComFA
MADFLYLERKKRKRVYKNHQLVLPFKLANSQMKGQAFIEQCYIDKKDGFLHAVCGAGKTEMCLSTIHKALNEQKSIIFVIPRVEIIKQLYLRFKAYFPKTAICALYQNAPFIESADLYISTPQQLMRFYHEFDLIFIDEADAFPFYNNAYLNRLLMKSKRANSVTICISATMPKRYQQMIDKGDYQYHLIPERFHQMAMMIPVFKTYRYPFSNVILEAIRAYSSKQDRLLIYFPSIHLMTRFHYFLEKNGVSSKMISSKTIYKNQVLKGFTNRDYNILLSTTILERGITFKRCDVFVIDADHQIFDQDTLIQIAGRVGRDAEFHQGSLIFYAQYLSAEMKKAKQEIKRLNRLMSHDL